MQKLQQILGTEFCSGNFKCDMDAEVSHRIMSFPKISIGKIGEQIQQCSCWDCWGDIGG